MNVVTDEAAEGVTAHISKRTDPAIARGRAGDLHTSRHPSPVERRVEMNGGRNPALQGWPIGAARGSRRDEQSSEDHTRCTVSGRHAPTLLRQTVERQTFA